MHELTITESILKIVVSEAEKHRATRVALIRLKVGEMTHVDPSSVEFYLEIMGKGTIAEGARVEADLVPLRAICRHCSDEFAVIESRFTCPSCGSGQTDVVAGRELYVDSIEIE
jgi:hydrogenase nickel incorporation protein HypA/HybF